MDPISYSVSELNNLNVYFEYPFQLYYIFSKHSNENYTKYSKDGHALGLHEGVKTLKISLSVSSYSKPNHKQFEILMTLVPVQNPELQQMQLTLTELCSGYLKSDSQFQNNSKLYTLLSFSPLENTCFPDRLTLQQWMQNVNKGEVRSNLKFESSKVGKFIFGVLRVHTIAWSEIILITGFTEHKMRFLFFSILIDLYMR